MPIGTILPYIGNLDDIPTGWHLCDGTDGTPNLLDNRFLEGDASPGTFKSPGLPNITGLFFDKAHPSVVQGAFYVAGNGAAVGWYTDQRGPTGFNAELGRKYWHKNTYGTTPTDMIYGNSATVQPKAYTVLYIMKIA